MNTEIMIIHVDWGTALTFVITLALNMNVPGATCSMAGTEGNAGMSSRAPRLHARLSRASGKPQRTIRRYNDSISQAFSLDPASVAGDMEPSWQERESVLWKLLRISHFLQDTDTLFMDISMHWRPRTQSLAETPPWQWTVCLLHIPSKAQYLGGK